MYDDESLDGADADARAQGRFQRAVKKTDTMHIVKTELEWPYTPVDFFEAPYRWQTDDYTLVANAGTVLVTLTTPSDPVDAELQSQITKTVAGLFLARQLLKRRA